MAVKAMDKQEAPPSASPAGIPYARGRDRNTPWIVFGVLLTTLGALGAFLVASNLADRIDVVVTARAVRAGEPISPGDLTSVAIGGGDGARAIAASRLPELVDSVSRADLAEGTIIHPDQLVDAAELEERTVVVGAEMTPGQYPVASLASGQVVQMIGVSGETSFDDEGAGATVLGQATIVGVSTLSQPDDYLVSLRMVERLAPVVSERAQQGRLRVVALDGDDTVPTGGLGLSGGAQSGGP